MLRAQTGPKTKEEALAKLKKSFGPAAKAIKKVRDSTEAVSNPANFSAMKTFIAEDRKTIMSTINATEAEEKKISKDAAFTRREKIAARNKRLLADDHLIMLSDEQSASDEDYKVIIEEDGPGGDQMMVERQVEDTPMDFTNVNAELLFGKRREVYRLETEKLDALVDCQLCKLIFDYTKTCNHFTMETDLKEDQLKQFSKQSQSEKLQALAKITRSLDILSTARISSFMLKKQISELLAMYL